MRNPLDATVPNPIVPASLRTLSERDLIEEIQLLRQHKPRHEWLLKEMGTSWQQHCDDLERLALADRAKRRSV